MNTVWLVVSSLQGLAVDPVPADHTRYVGDTSGFAAES